MDIEDKQNIFGSIFLLSNKFQIIGDRELGELSFKQWFLLVMISNLPKEPSLTDIAKATGTSRQNVKKMLVILEKKDYVVLNTLPEDRKSIRASLTEKCHEYFEGLDKSANEVLEKIFADICDDKVQAISEAFAVILKNVDVILSAEKGMSIQ